MPYFLKVLVAPEATDIGKKLPLNEGVTLVGRISPPCHVALEGKKVSKKHAGFSVQGAKVSVEDLRSSNGIFVNGKQVNQTDLKARDRLVIGEYTLELAEG